MKTFTDEAGRRWVVTAVEEQTPRHHTRWYLVFRPEDGAGDYPLKEIRWQTRATAERTVRSMSEFELRRRLETALARAGAAAAAS